MHCYNDSKFYDAQHKFVDTHHTDTLSPHQLANTCAHLIMYTGGNKVVCNWEINTIEVETPCRRGGGIGRTGLNGGRRVRSVCTSMCATKLLRSCVRWLIKQTMLATEAVTATTTNTKLANFLQTTAKAVIIKLSCRQQSRCHTQTDIYQWLLREVEVGEWAGKAVVPTFQRHNRAPAPTMWDKMITNKTTTTATTKTTYRPKTTTQTITIDYLVVNGSHAKA